MRNTFIYVLLAISSQLATAEAVRVTASKTVGVHGDFMAVAAGSVWETSGGVLHRIDPYKMKVIAKISLDGAGVRGLAGGGGFLWAPDVANDFLWQVDTKTNKVVRKIPLKMSGSEGSIAYGDDSIFVSTDKGEGSSKLLVRISPKTGEVINQIEVPKGVAGIAFEGGKAFCTSPSGAIYIWKAPYEKIITISEVKSPRFIAAGGGSAWALDQDTGEVLRIDAATEKITARIDAGADGGGGDIAYGEGFVWTVDGNREVLKIDPVKNKVVGDYDVSGMGDAIRSGFGAIWVSGGELHRINVSGL